MLVLGLVLAAVLSGQSPTRQSADTLAITNVAVLPMDSSEILENRTVLIARGRIVSIAPSSRSAPLRRARVVDARGKYLLPGLADMHVHLSTSEEFPFYIGNGVLTLRDLNGSPQTLAWRDSIAKGELLGPRLFVSGPMIAGADIPWRNKVTPTNAAESKATVTAQKAAGYDQIKIYDGISREVFNAAIATAKSLGMLSTGHIPDSVGFDGVLASGMTGLEHLDKTVYATVGETLDTMQIPSIVARIKASGVWVTPTLESMIQLSKVATGRYDSLINRPEALAAPKDLRNFWTSITSRLKRNRTLPANARCDPYCEFQLRLADSLARVGVPMMTGTDLPNVVLVPGYSLHGEIDALSLAGLTNYEVLKASTSAPARFLRQQNDWGTVAVGQRANLVLADANPLVDLHTLRDPAGVILGGRWIPRSGLRKLRKQ